TATRPYYWRNPGEEADERADGASGEHIGDPAEGTCSQLLHSTVPKLNRRAGRFGYRSKEGAFLLIALHQADVLGAHDREDETGKSCTGTDVYDLVVLVQQRKKLRGI